MQNFLLINGFQSAITPQKIGEIPFNAIESQEERVHRQLDHISYQLVDLQKLATEENDSVGSLEEDMIKTYLRSELEAIANMLVDASVLVTIYHPRHPDTNS